MPHPCPSPRARAPRGPGREPVAGPARGLPHGPSGGWSRSVSRGLAGVLAAALLAVGGPVPLGGLAPSAAGASGPADPEQPLRVSLDTLSPAVLPARGPVRLTGTVTNTTDERWADVRMYAFSGAEPILTADALEAAVATDPSLDVGGRTTQEGTFDEVGDLAPGASAPWSIRVPRGLLDIPTGVPGVYWLGVHALGSDQAGRDQFADGRARTFVPVVPRSSLASPGAPPASVPVSVVVPVRRPVAHEPDGSVARVGRWVRDLRPDGSLRALLEVGTAAGDRPITWLVDPAVLRAVQRLAAGNPGRSLDPTLPAGPDAEPTEGASPSGSATDGTPTGSPDAGTTSGSPGAGTDGTDGTDDQDGAEGTDGDGLPVDPPTPLEQEAAGLAETWLERATTLMAADELLALPYADLDVAAAVHRAPDLLARATALSSTTLEALELPATPAAAPPGGRLDAASIRALPDDALVLLEPESVADLPEELLEGPAEATEATDPRVLALGDREVLLVDPPATAGGPGPDDPLSAVAVRQRLLAEAALDVLGAAEDALAAPVPAVVAMLPRDWRPQDTLGFFAALDAAPWVRLQTVGTVAAGAATAVDELVYDEEQRRAEVPSANLEAVIATVRAGALLESILTRNDEVAAVVGRQALGTASYHARRHPAAWRVVAEGIADQVAGALGQVTVDAPEAVTLSSESGGFPASVVNELDQPVTVRVEARTTSPLTVTAPAEVVLEPGERTSVLLTASTRRIGLHDVELVVTNTDGVPLGSSEEVVIRSAQVSWIIWVVLAAGATLLFGAITVRLVRRVRAARRTPGEAS